MEDASEGWDQDLPIMVIPLDLDSFMECFWADSSPYFIPGLLSNEKNEVVNYTKWKKANNEEKMVFGDKIIGARRIEKHISSNPFMRMYTAPYVY